MQRLKGWICLLLAVVVTACASVPEENRVADPDGLAREIMRLSPDVSPEEATRVAQISYRYSLQLRQEYNVTDGALVHNAKVNRGTRPRGLCWHWADDLEARLRLESLETLDLHRAIANHDNIRIEHSTVVVSARGDTMREGIVLDPWRYGGYLFWSPVLQDDRYNWEERHVVFALRDQ